MRFLVVSLISLGLSQAFIARVGRPTHDKLNSRSGLTMTADQSIVVVSPPGGVGEVAAVSAACRGNTVRWFVVSDGDDSAVALAPHTLDMIAEASGALSLAGASVEELTTGTSLDAVSAWCNSANGIICSYDGCDSNQEYLAAIRLAAREATRGVTGMKVAVLAADEDLEEDVEDSSDAGGVNKLVGSLFSSGPEIPPTLVQSLGGSPTVVRHGQLFGKPESSPEFSPLVGGPRRQPAITEEYAMRNVRVDPFIVSGNVMASSTSKACRHAVGEAATLLATKSIESVSEPVSISSQMGNEKWTIGQWEEEFLRVKELISSGKASTLFRQDLVVQDVSRLADWFATKWAPAVMRTYDIAAIRIGARPVYAQRVGDNVEIVWQELVDFKSVVVGKMVLEITKDGISATREAGDASQGFGSVSRNPLPGEDVLVRRLADGASQCIDKGLAKKAPKKKEAKTAAEPVSPVTSVQDAGSVETTEAERTSTAGPRQAGARRSTPRERRGTNRSS